MARIVCQFSRSKCAYLSSRSLLLQLYTHHSSLYMFYYMFYSCQAAAVENEDGTTQDDGLSVLDLVKHSVKAVRGYSLKYPLKCPFFVRSSIASCACLVSGLAYAACPMGCVGLLCVLYVCCGVSFTGGLRLSQFLPLRKKAFCAYIPWVCFSLMRRVSV